MHGPGYASKGCFINYAVKALHGEESWAASRQGRMFQTIGLGTTFGLQGKNINHDETLTTLISGNHLIGPTATK